MKWQQFLPLIIVAGAAMLLVWRSSGRKSTGCGCKSGCTHEPVAAPKKEDAAR